MNTKPKFLCWVRIESPGFVPAENGVRLYPNLPFMHLNCKAKKGLIKKTYIYGPSLPLLRLSGTIFVSPPLDLVYLGTNIFQALQQEVL